MLVPQLEERINKGSIYYKKVVLELEGLMCMFL